MKSFKDLLEEVREKSIKRDIVVSEVVVEPKVDTLREDYVSGKILNIGESVITSEGVLAEIVSRGPNYVTLVSEGKTFKKWISEVTTTDEKLPGRTQLYKESFIIKGFRTKNFSRPIAEQFSAASKLHEDSYALYNCVVCVDSLLGASRDTITENFNKYKVLFDRAAKYSNKLGIQVEELKQIEDWLLEAAIFEGLKFSVTDKKKIAQLIAMTAGYAPTEGQLYTDIVNESAKVMKNKKVSPEGWKIMGALLNKCTEAGIKWNKDIFSKSTQRFMGLQ